MHACAWIVSMNRKKAICMYIVLLLVYFSSFNAHDFPKEVVLDDRKLLEHLRGWKANHSASKAISHALQRKFHSDERFQGYCLRASSHLGLVHLDQA